MVWNVWPAPKTSHMEWLSPKVGFVSVDHFARALKCLSGVPYHQTSGAFPLTVVKTHLRLVSDHFLNNQPRTIALVQLVPELLRRNFLLSFDLKENFGTQELAMHVFLRHAKAFAWAFINAN